MFAGHYSAALVAKGVESRVPLWVLLLAAQLVDVAWVALVALGAERVRIDATLPSNPLDLEHMPYTHSLLATALWALAAGIVVARVPILGGTRRAGVVVGLVVASHWGLDWLVHRPDLTLFGVPPKLGLGLWNQPMLAYALEVACVAGSAAFCVARGGLSRRGSRAVAGIAGLLIVLQTSTTFGPIPGSVAGLLALVLFVFLAVAYAGHRAERWATQTPA